MWVFCFHSRHWAVPEPYPSDPQQSSAPSGGQICPSKTITVTVTI